MSRSTVPRTPRPFAESIRVFLGVTAGTLAGLLVALLWVGSPERWPPPETPPRQSEAVDGDALRVGRVMHSATALQRLVREPQNTWSNVAFILVGAFVIARRRSGLSAASGWTLVAVGVGSFLYHASASRTVRHLDVGAMYWLFLMLMLVACAASWPRLKPGLDRHALLVLAATFVAAVLLTLGRNVVVFGFKPFALSLSTGIAATAAGLALTLRLLRVRTWRMFWQVNGTLAVFAGALLCQIGDRPGNWFSAPQAAVQAHALWHVLSAVAVCAAILLLDGAARRTETASAVNATTAVAPLR